jgi:chemotaxis protein MotA
LLVIIGYVVVLASVFGGFALAGGHLHSLFQPVELLMIGGAATGAFFVGNNGKAIKATLKALPSVLKGSKKKKKKYI